MKALIFTILIFFLSLSKATSQSNESGQILKGRIISVSEHVMFATIGIVDANIGTVSDENGYFELEIPDQLIKKRLTISHVGYKTLSLGIDSLLSLNPLEIELKERVTYLNQVVISSKKIKGKVREYGNTKKHDLFLWIQNGDKGSEIVTLIDAESEIFLNSVSVNILNDLEKDFTLLLNIYAVNKTTQLPDRQLLKAQKIIKSNMKKGWLEVDLTKENMVLAEPFFVGFQWVDVDEPLPLIGGKSNNSKNSLIRYKALGIWENFAEWDIKIKGTIYKTP